MLNQTDKSAIARRFSHAAACYEGAAHVQAAIALDMVERLAQLALPPAARVLEIGCGTGLVTRPALRRLSVGHWLATDIAPSMVAACRERTPPHPALSVAVMDGEAPALAGGFDLICSSLALQWFPDPQLALRRWRGLLAPGGRLLVATLAAGTFAEWHAALAAAGAAPTGPAYADAAAMHGWLPGLDVAVETRMERHGDAGGFLASLRRIGADYSPARPGIATLRRAMRLLEAPGEVCVRYRVAWLGATADAIGGM